MTKLFPTAWEGSYFFNRVSLMQAFLFDNL